MLRDVMLLPLQTHYVLRFGRTWLQFDKYLGNGATEG